MEKQEQIKALIASYSEDTKEVLLERIEAILHSYSSSDVNQIYNEKFSNSIPKHRR
jgi:hypothetical protein